jgi:hypothetical protein
MGMDVVTLDLDIHKPNIKTLRSPVDMGNVEIKRSPNVALVIVGEGLQELAHLLGGVESSDGDRSYQIHSASLRLISSTAWPMALIDGWSFEISAESESFLSWRW